MAGSSERRQRPKTLSSGECERFETDDDDGDANSLKINKPATTSDDNEDLEFRSWFHGRLDRAGAERLVQNSGSVPGSFLIRESDRRPKTYVLTYVTQSRTTLHFPIVAVCGHYFINQHEFASLSSLVNYFSSNAIAGGNERLAYPVAPSSPVNLMKRYVVAVVSFCGMKDTDELSFTKGDVLEVQEKLENGWLWAISKRTNDSGCVFGGLTEDVNLCNECPEKLCYVRFDITRQEAHALLCREETGAYLVLPSQSSPGDYTLLVNCGKKVEKFQIKRNTFGYEIGGRQFDGLHDIIARYSEVEIYTGVTLEVPVAKAVAQLDNNNEGDLYNKLRSTRLTSRDSCPDAVKSGYLNFKARKRWKLLYFLLKDTEGQLFCYENEKRTKPKVVLELFSCGFYFVHRSLFNIFHCFVLIQIQFNTAFYFYASTANECEDWVSALKPLCLGGRHCPSPFSSIKRSESSGNIGNLRQVNQIMLTVHEVKLNTAKSNTELSAVVAFNEAKVCRTFFATYNESVVWDEKFNFDDISQEVKSVTIFIESRTKRSKEAEIGFAKVEINCGEFSSFTCDEWLDIQPVSSSWKQDSIGQCHVKINYCQETIMPLDEYRSLSDLLRSNDFLLCHSLSMACSDSRQRLAETLLSYFDFAEALKLILAEIQRDIDASDDVRLLFRSSSLAVALIDELILREGQNYAVQVLRSAVTNFQELKTVLEIESSKVDDAGILSSNCTQLLKFTEEICEKIFETAGSFPKTLRYIFSNLKQRVMQKWAQDPLITYRAISSFVFLRLFCLTLVLPRQYQLLSDVASDCCFRNLVLAAKVLQSAANFSDVHAKRDYDVVSDSIAAFANRIKPKMISFLNSISEPVSETIDHLAFRPRQSDPACYLARVFYICQKQEKALRTYEAQYPTLKNLISVIELLKRHQKCYAVGPAISVV